MSRISSKELPKKGDLVIGEVDKITKHGIYLNLIEYSVLSGYCHISEIAGTFIRNIRNFVRIDQRVVARVQRVDVDKKQVDVSLKRVSEHLKREKIQEYKRQNAALAIINLIAEKTDRNSEEVRDLIEDQLLSTYGTMYHGFEEIAALEESALEPLDIPDDIKEGMLDVAKSSIQISTVESTSNLGVRSFASNGVEHVKKLLIAAQDAADQFDEVDSEITTIGAPQYRIHLEARSFEEIVEVLDAIEEKLEAMKTELDIEYILERK